MRYSSGTLVKNLGPALQAKLFSSSLIPLGPRVEVGLLTGIGVVLEHSGTDVRIFCNGITGWCWCGNLVVVE